MVSNQALLAKYVPSLDDTGDGTTTMYDLSGTEGQDATLSNSSVWTADTNDGGVRCIKFDTTNNYYGDAEQNVTAVNTTQSAKIRCATFSYWVKREASGNHISWAFNHGATTSDYGVIYLWTDNNLYFQVDGSTYAYVANSSTDWQNIIVTFDSSGATNSDKVKIYVDNSAQSLTFNGTFGDRINYGYHQFGRLRSVSPTYSNGRLDSMHVFGRIISSSERTSLASSRSYDVSTSGGGSGKKALMGHRSVT